MRPTCTSRLSGSTRSLSPKLKPARTAVVARCSRYSSGDRLMTAAAPNPAGLLTFSTKPPGRAPFARQHPHARAAGGGAVGRVERAHPAASAAEMADFAPLYPPYGPGARLRRFARHRGPATVMGRPECEGRDEPDRATARDFPAAVPPERREPNPVPRARPRPDRAFGQARFSRGVDRRAPFRRLRDHL